MPDFKSYPLPASGSLGCPPARLPLLLLLFDFPPLRPQSDENRVAAHSTVIASKRALLHISRDPPAPPGAATSYRRRACLTVLRSWTDSTVRLTILRAGRRGSRRGRPEVRSKAPRLTRQDSTDRHRDHGHDGGESADGSVYHRTGFPKNQRALPRCSPPTGVAA